MRKPIIPAILAAATILAAPAMAQPNSRAQQKSSGQPPQTMSAIQPAKNISDTEIQSFATAVVKIQKINADKSVAAAAKKPEIMSALKASGLTPQRFNGIAKAAQTEPKIRARVQKSVMADMTQK